MLTSLLKFWTSASTNGSWIIDQTSEKFLQKLRQCSLKKQREIFTTWLLFTEVLKFPKFVLVGDVGLRESNESKLAKSPED